MSEMCAGCGRSLAAEEWRDTDVAGYKVSDHGRVVGRRGRVLKPRAIATGYLSVSLGAGNHSYIHRLVCAAFNGPAGDPAKTQVAHWDGVPSNNHATNLRWATPTENALDMPRHWPDPWKKLLRLGEQHSNAKLKWDDIGEIERLCASGVTKTELARRFGVSRRTITRVVCGESWTRRPEGDE